MLGVARGASAGSVTCENTEKRRTMKKRNMASYRLGVSEREKLLEEVEACPLSELRVLLQQTRERGGPLEKYYLIYLLILDKENATCPLWQYVSARLHHAVLKRSALEFSSLFEELYNLYKHVQSTYAEKEDTNVEEGQPGEEEEEKRKDDEEEEEV